MNESSPAPVYRRYAPSPALARHAEAIWVQQCAPAPGAAPTTVVPCGRVDLVFCHADPFARLQHGAWHVLPAAHAVGQQRQPLVVRATGATGIVIVRLKPWGARALFGAALAGMNEQLVDLELAWGHGGLEDLLGQLAAAGSMALRARLAEGFVLARLLDDALDPLAAAAVRAIHAGWGRRSVAALAADFGLGRRQFNRRFTEAVGAAPKQLSGVLRAQKAVACLRAGSAAQDVVARCGYSDQSHLIHDVIAHTGRRPGELARADASAATGYFNSDDVDSYCGITYL